MADNAAAIFALDLGIHDNVALATQNVGIHILALQRNDLAHTRGAVEPDLFLGMQSDHMAGAVHGGEHLHQIVDQHAGAADTRTVIKGAFFQEPGIVLVDLKRVALDLVIVDFLLHRPEMLGDLQVLKFRLLQAGFQIVYIFRTAGVGNISPDFFIAHIHTSHIKSINVGRQSSKMWWGSTSLRRMLSSSALGSGVTGTQHTSSVFPRIINRPDQSRCSRSHPLP